jgi:hypothetical protein
MQAQTEGGEGDSRPIDGKALSGARISDRAAKSQMPTPAIYVE